MFFYFCNYYYIKNSILINYLLLFLIYINIYYLIDILNIYTLNAFELILFFIILNKRLMMYFLS